MTSLERISATALPRELRTIALPGRAQFGHRKLVQLMIDGDIPGEKINGKWTVRRDDLPAIAQRLGLAEPEAPSGRRRARPAPPAMAAA